MQGDLTVNIRESFWEVVYIINFLTGFIHRMVFDCIFYCVTMHTLYIWKLATEVQLASYADILRDSHAIFTARTSA